jgi:ketosteroid isomerase-like protein
MKGSEARIDMRVAIVQTVRDGLIVRGREFASQPLRAPPHGPKISGFPPA